MLLVTSDDVLKTIGNKIKQARLSEENKAILKEIIIHIDKNY